MPPGSTSPNRLLLVYSRNSYFWYNKPLMNSEKEPITNKQRLLNLTLVGVVSQVGCLTLVIILAALFFGLFLDNRFDTRPWFTIGLVLASVPVSLVLMVIISRAAVKKIHPDISKQKKQEEQHLGE